MKPKPPMETYLLVALLIILSFAAIYGGISLIIDPSGSSLNLNISESNVAGTFNDFTFQSIGLILFFGIFPLLLIYPLIKKPKLVWAGAFNIYPRRYWAWTYTLFLGFLLIVWADIQIYMIGYFSYLQIVNSIYGVVIIFVCLLPEQINYFSKWKLDPYPPRTDENKDTF